MIDRPSKKTRAWCILYFSFINSQVKNTLGPTPKPLLGGSWVVISGVISRVTMLITHIRGLINPFITTHEPPSQQ